MLLIDCWSNYFSAGELIGPPGPGYNVPPEPFSRRPWQWLFFTTHTTRTYLSRRYISSRMGYEEKPFASNLFCDVH